MSRAQIAAAAARLPPALSPPIASRLGIDADLPAVGSDPFQAGDDVVERAGKGRLGGEPIVDGEDRDAGLDRELRAEHVVAVEIAEHPAAAMGEDQARQLGIGQRRDRAVDPHLDRSGRARDAAVDDGDAVGPRTLRAGAGREILLARRFGRERDPRRPVGRRHEVQESLGFGIECHERHSNSPRPCFVTRRMLRCGMTFEPDPAVPPPPRPSRWSRAWTGMRAWRPGRGTAAAAGGARLVWRWGWRLLLVVLILYYPLGAMIVQSIDDDPQFQPRSVAPGESRAVATAADLVTREVDINTWTPMMPFFTPAGILDNMPNFQRGIMAALGRFSTELMDQLGRTRGSSQTDRDLEQARGFLNEQPNVWIWQPTVSIWPSATSAQKYRAGRDKLMAYNKRLASGQAVFERRADNLQALIDRIANDHGSDSAAIDQHIIEQAGNLFDRAVRRHLLFQQGPALRQLPAAARARQRLRGHHPRAGPDQRLERHGGDLPHRLAARSLGRVERLARRVPDPQPSRRAGLLPAAGAHPVARAQRHPAEVRAAAWRSTCPLPNSR